MRNAYGYLISVLLLVVTCIAAAWLSPTASAQTPAWPGQWTTGASAQIQFLQMNGRAMTLECGPEATIRVGDCVQSTKRIRLEGAWNDVEVCWRGECRRLDVLFPEKAPVEGPPR